MRDRSPEVRRGVRPLGPIPEPSDFFLRFGRISRMPRFQLNERRGPARDSESRN